MELHLTDRGRALRKQAEAIPSCILEATGQSVEDLLALKDELVALRARLQDAD
ncbi:hypothetical protein D3C80_2079550 [compost metagenome]